MYQKNGTWKLCLIAFLIAMTLLCLGCDGAINVKGKVYAQPNQAGDSLAYVDEQVNLGANLHPLQGAKVTLYHGGDYSRRPLDKSTLWQDSGETDSGGQSSTLTKAFSFTFVISDPFPYVPPPIALLVMPTEGPTSGGTQVKIYGQYFSESTTATFGGVPVSGLELIDGTLLQATTGEHPAGKVDVTVSNPSDSVLPENPTSTTTPDAFTYI